MGDLNDVMHLIFHKKSKHEIFVTTNAKSYVSDGRREHLMRAINVIVMTPEEVVKMLEEKEGWE